MLSLILSLVAVLAVKFSLIAGIRLWVVRRVPAFSDSLLAAWLIFQSLLVAGFLLLSVFSALRPGSVWFVLLAACAVTVVRSGPAALWRSVAQPVRAWFAAHDRGPVAICLITTGVMLAALAAHALFFYDSTEDALNFLLPRVAMWYQQHSVLAVVPRHLFECFAWEWNSDFNVLFYFLATGRDQACAFANVETWLVLLLAVYCFGRALGGHRLLLWPVALLVGTMPVLLFLGMTIKSEPAAFVGLLAGLGWMIRALRHPEEPRHHLLAIMALSFASGCKVSCVPLTGLLIVMLLLQLAVRRSVRPWVGLGILSLAALNNFRHPVNLWQYGRLLDRVSNQPRGISMDNLAANLHGILSHVFVRGLDVTQYFALFFGCGLVGIAALVVAGSNGATLVACGRRWNAVVPARSTWLVAGCLAGSFLFFASSLPWYAWSFRYYLPWLLPVFLVPLVAACRADSPPAPATILTLSASLCCLSMLHLFAVLRPSEITPGPSLSAAFARAAQATDLERKLGRHSAALEMFQLNLGPADPAGRPLNIIVLSNGFSVHFPLFGDNATNRVTFAASLADLTASLAARPCDLVVLTEPGPATAAELSAALPAGYHATGRAKNMLFFKPEAVARQAHLAPPAPAASPAAESHRP
jgi:hypothetical protein